MPLTDAAPAVAPTRPTMQPLLVHLTPRDALNPFYTDVPLELERRGWQVAFTADPREAIEVLASQPTRPAVAHLHQLEPFYDHGDPTEAARRGDALLRFLDELRERRVGLVHTMHNPRRHDGRLLDLDDRLVRGVCERASAVVVLGDRARQRAGSLTDPERVHVVRHPNYVDAYGAPIPQVEARRALAIPHGSFLFVMLGGLKPYKGHELVIGSFDRAGLVRARLAIVGGGAPGPDYVERLQGRADALHGRVRLVIRRFPPDEVPLWLGAADVAVFGFSDMFMSGSVMLALSYGLPVLVPRVGALPEYVEEGVNGSFYTPDDPEALALGMERMWSGILPRPQDVIATVADQSIATTTDRMGELLRAAAEEAWRS